MKTVTEKKTRLWFWISVAGTVCLFFISMCFGRYGVKISDVFRFFTGQSVPELSSRVLTNLRIPRTIVAALVGIALSVSGVIYQGVFNNKLVSPDLLGVSSGSSVGACFAILIGASSVIVSLFSFALGFATVCVTVFVARLFGNRNNVVLLLSGIAIGGLMSSGVGLMKYLADDDSKLSEMTYWLLGDVSASTYREVFVLLPIVAVCSAVALLLGWKLNILSFGEKEARSLGVKYKVTVFVLIICATLLTAGAVAVSGTIGWVGLVIPNLVRLFVGSDNRKILPFSMAFGASFMMIVDTLCRTLAPNEIPLGVVTGIIGTPVFLYAIFKRRKDLR